MINLIPLCKDCNIEKADLIVNPDDYIKHLKPKYMEEIRGMYEGYIKSFDYLTRNNLLANDVYEFQLPAITNIGCYSSNRRRNRKTASYGGKKYKVFRANLNDLDRLCEYYVKYLKKYNSLEGTDAVRANILYWLTYGCIYYIPTKEGGIQAFSAVTAYHVETGQQSWYSLRILPFFCYSNIQNKLMFTDLTDSLAHLVVEENNLAMVYAEFAVVKGDRICEGTSLGTHKPKTTNEVRFNFYYVCIMNEKLCPQEICEHMSDRELNEYLEENGYTKAIDDFFEKLKANRSKLSELSNEELYAPFGETL